MADSAKRADAAMTASCDCLQCRLATVIRAEQERAPDTSPREIIDDVAGILGMLIGDVFIATRDQTLTTRAITEAIATMGRFTRNRTGGEVSFGCDDPAPTDTPARRMHS